MYLCMYSPASVDLELWHLTIVSSAYNAWGQYADEGGVIRLGLIKDGVKDAALGLRAQFACRD